MDLGKTVVRTVRGIHPGETVIVWGAVSVDGSRVFLERSLVMVHGCSLLSDLPLWI